MNFRNLEEDDENEGEVENIDGTPGIDVGDIRVSAKIKGQRNTYSKVHVDNK